MLVTSVRVSDESLLNYEVGFRFGQKNFPDALACASFKVLSVTQSRSLWEYKKQSSRRGI